MGERMRKRRRSVPDVKREESRRLSELIPFPSQALLDGTTSEDEDRELREDIKRYGLRTPIDILPTNAAGLPTNTVLDGHRRREMLTALGQNEVRVIVRYDLANDDRQRIDEEFFRFSLMRRQLSPLAKARMAKGVIESEREGVSPQNGELRDRIGKMIGMSGRNLDRHLAVLRTPMEIQAAFERKALSLIEAEKVSRLTEEQRNTIARRIQSGESPKKVAAEYGPQKRTRHVKPNDAFVAFMKAIRRGCGDLTGRADRISPRLIADNEDSLRRARRLFSVLLDRRPTTPEEETAGW
ncbi:MAG: hypothetical protein C0483_07590 [Pirellula sp.]|nr:hypothetical protein [Pirellula sp.]